MGLIEKAFTVAKGWVGVGARIRSSVKYLPQFMLNESRADAARVTKLGGDCGYSYGLIYDFYFVKVKY